MKDYLEQLAADFSSSGRSIEALMAEARQTRAQRIRQAQEEACDHADYLSSEILARLALKKNVPAVNDRLWRLFSGENDDSKERKELIHDTWSLVMTPFLIRLYYYFGSKGEGLLEPRVEKALLEHLWRCTQYKNDIFLTRESTWHLVSSENHDLNAKAGALISSQIFMELEDYKDRVYPDDGTGGGTGSWFQCCQALMKGDNFEHGPKGRAHHKDEDPGEYRAADHYKAWVRYFREYIKERARRGFFLEVAAPGYMKWTMSFLSMIYEFCRDPQLKQDIGKFFDLIWCEWAQDQINGRRGGAKTRGVCNEDVMEHDSMYVMAQFLMGGPGNACHNFYFQMFQDYELPKVVWDMVLNRKKLGCYVYQSRKPGEEENVYPRPLGAERTLLCDTDSRIHRYSYVTPSFILGTQMDHPMAIHSHLSVTKRLQGLITDASCDSYILPIGLMKKPDGSWTMDACMYRSVQSKNILITQQSKGYYQLNPEWFPQIPHSTEPYGLYIGKELPLTEKEGWIFLQDGNTCVAMRPAFGGYVMETPRVIRFEDPFAPAILHAEELDKFGSLEKFQAFILGNPLVISKTVVPDFNIVEYGTEDNRLYLNAACAEPPMVNGEYVDYEIPYAFHSPWMQGKYGEGRIRVRAVESTLELNFED